MTPEGYDRAERRMPARLIIPRLSGDVFAQGVERTTATVKEFAEQLAQIVERTSATVKEFAEQLARLKAKYPDAVPSP